MSGHKQNQTGAAKTAAPALPLAPESAAEAGSPIIPSSAPEKSAREAELESANADLLSRLAEMEQQLLARIAGELLTTEEEPQPQDEYAPVRKVLKQHGLKQAWQDEAGNVHFDAAYVATLPADSLTLITAE